jgi:LPPG:FO 2-phospho-L-lactate transferase
MTDAQVETWIVTDEGEMHFQEYLVKKRMKPTVIKVIIKNIDQAEPPPGVLSYIENSRTVIICPSNPIISIGPILHVKGVRDALVRSKAKIIAISPLIGGTPLKGPADRLMKGLGLEVSSAGVARLYRDFLDVMVIDEQDGEEASQIQELGVDTLVVNTLMSDAEKAANLSRALMELL